MKVDLRKRLTLWARENGWTALIALILALLVYFTILELVSNPKLFTVPVEIDREAGVALMAVSPPSVQVTFRGAQSELLKLDSADLRVVVKNPRSRNEADTVRIPLKARNVRGHSGLRVMQIDPPVVEVTYDRQGEREFAIAPPMIEGKPFRGRVEVEFTPKTAIVRGARLQLDHMHDAGVKLKIEPINVEGRVQGFSRQAAILPPADAWKPEIVPTTVQVKIDILPDNIQRDFEEMRVRLAGLERWTNGVARVEPATVTVRLTGWSEALQRIDPATLRVYADLSEAKSTTNEIPLNVLFPLSANIEGVMTLPASVRLVPPSEEQVPLPASVQFDPPSEAGVPLPASVRLVSPPENE